MNLTAHPYAVLAELQWKQEQLGRAGLATGRATRAAHRGPRAGAAGRPWRGLVARLAARRPRHTPRPV